MLQEFGLRDNRRERLARYSRPDIPWHEFQPAFPPSLDGSLRQIDFEVSMLRRAVASFSASN